MLFTHRDESRKINTNILQRNACSNSNWTNGFDTHIKYAFTIRDELKCNIQLHHIDLFLGFFSRYGFWLKKKIFFFASFSSGHHSHSHILKVMNFDKFSWIIQKQFVKHFRLTGTKHHLFTQFNMANLLFAVNSAQNRFECKCLNEFVLNFFYCSMRSHNFVNYNGN